VLNLEQAIDHLQGGLFNVKGNRKLLDSDRRGNPL